MEKWEARSGFHFSMPHAVCQPRLWCRRSIAQRRVWPDGVVMDAPAFGQHPQLFHRVEDLAVEELISKLRVEALAVAVLPRRDLLLDVQRRCFWPAISVGPSRRTPAHSTTRSTWKEGLVEGSEPDRGSVATEIRSLGHGWP